MSAKVGDSSLGLARGLILFLEEELMVEPAGPIQHTGSVFTQSLPLGNHLESLPFVS